MGDLSNRMKAIHNNQVLVGTKEKIPAGLSREEWEGLVRANDFVDLMKDYNIPCEVFYARNPHREHKGWVVAETSRNRDQSGVMKFLPGLVILEGLTIHKWKWSKFGSRELIGSAQSKAYFSHECNFMLLCERVLGLELANQKILV